MTIRQTHTYAELEVSAAAYDEIAAKLKAAGYDHAFMSGEDVNGHATIDMHGIGITRMPLDPKEEALGLDGSSVLQDDLRDMCRALGLPDGARPQSPHEVFRECIAVIKGRLPAALGLLWANAVRAEWLAFVEKDPELKAQHAVALELMREDGYTMEPDPVCGLPGAKAPVAIVDGKEAICYSWAMGQASPLSAIYTNKVRTVQSAAARVAKALAEEAVKAPPEWPIRIATGETFHSIAEMEQSPIDAVRELATLMRARDEAARP